MASNFKTQNFKTSLKFDEKYDFYEVRVRRRRNWWWLLLLLLPLLLLIRCERDIEVVCVDEHGDPIPGAATTLAYDARYLWNDGLFTTLPQYHELVTDSVGCARYEGLPCSVFSYVFAPLTRVTATGERYPYSTESATKLFHFTSRITLTMRADTTARDVDIVMVVDNTGSMEGIHESIKNNSLRLYSALIDKCKAIDKPLRKVRMKFISYGDFEDSEMVESDLYNLPAHDRDLAKFISGMSLTDGGDAPENSLEALSRALDTPWTENGNVRRFVVVLITDDATLPLGRRKGERFYPRGVASNMTELRAKWDKLDPESRRLLLFAPDDESWREVKAWPQTENISQPVEEISTDGLDAVLRIISESL